MVPSGFDAQGLTDELSRLEDLGVEGVSAPQVYGTPFVAVAAMAAANPRLKLGTDIAIALTRSPFETACAALDIDRLAGGRFTLGLGVGPRHWVDYFGADYDRPVSRVAEVIDILRHVEDGARSGVMKDYEGQFWQLRFENFQPMLPPLRDRVPVYVAALRERVCELVGERADGLIGHPVWSVDYALGRAQDAVARGAAKAGRDPREIGFHPFVVASVDADRQRAYQLAKPFVALYAGFEQYRDYFDSHGFESETTALIAAANEKNDCRDAAKLVPDEMVRTFIACGTPDEVNEWIAPMRERATSVLVAAPGWGLSASETAEKQKAIEEHVWTQ
jgi:alkanesulfonate monooxygenase SsuD/methylene tetrahydromethanopterin reductase-like flavin-dependent oxidoreductase (luciferase family)